MIFYVKKLSVTAFFAQTRPTIPPVPGAPATPPAGQSASKPGPKPYKDVITDKAVTKKGLFTVHKIEDKYFFEINDKMIGRDILYVNRVSKSSIQTAKGFYGYAGDQIGEGVIRFEKGPNQKIFLKNISFVVKSDSTRDMFRSVTNSNIQPIAMAFDISHGARQPRWRQCD
jgi:hypothetical protein